MRPKLKIASALIALGLTASLSACGITSVATETVDQLTPGYLYMDDLRQHLADEGIECLNYQKAEYTFGFREQGTCTFQASEITLTVYSDAATAKLMVETLKALGGYYLYSENWSIQTNDADAARTIEGMTSVEIAQ